jgi:hypothetical protein
MQLVTQLVNKFPKFYGIRRIITVIQRAHLWFLYLATLSHSSGLNSILLAIHSPI